MRLKSSFTRAALLISVVSILPNLKSEDAKEAIPGLAVIVEFTPVIDNSTSSEVSNDKYRCTAEITDLTTGKILGAPTIISKKGIPAKVKIGQDDPNVKDDFSIDFEVNLDKETKKATYSVVYTKEKKVLATQAGSLSVL